MGAQRILIAKDSPSVAQSVAEVARSFAAGVEAVCESINFETVYDRFETEVIVLDPATPGTDGNFLTSSGAAHVASSIWLSCATDRGCNPRFPAGIKRMQYGRWGYRRRWNSGA